MSGAKQPGDLGFVQEKVDVEESGKKRTYVCQGEAPVVKGRSVFIIGAHGSGRNDLARMLSARLEMPMTLAEDAEELAAVLDGRDGEEVVCVVERPALDDAALVVRMREAGPVFFVMADTFTVAERLGVTSTEGRAKIGSELMTDEPVYLSSLTFLLPATRKRENLLADALDKISLIRNR